MQSGERFEPIITYSNVINHSNKIPLVQKIKLIENN